MMQDEQLPLPGHETPAEMDETDLMAWAEPKYAREQVNAAGKFYVESMDFDDTDWTLERMGEWDHALAVINNWRASHTYPLNTFQMNLRNAARRVDSRALVAQRTKRLSSIGLKLARFPDMRLSQMQDIGGCRAVVLNVDRVRSLAQYYEKGSNIKHQRATVDDYVRDPKTSGYRGIHLVYRYYSDRRAKAMYNGLKIEMQLRSLYQHAWATAVETVGTFVQQALKSSVGQQEWLRFFALMGSAIAGKEKQPLVPGTPTNRRVLRKELGDCARHLDVANRLRSYSNAMRTIRQQSAQQARAHYYLLQLDSQQSELTVTGFRQDELTVATERYLEVERAARERPGADAVLVSVESLAALERAYPNYFADTSVFVQLLSQVLSGRESMILFTRRPVKRRGR